MGKREINRAIKHTGLVVEGQRGDGCFYFLNAEGHQVGESIYIAYLNQFSLERWVETAEDVKNEHSN